MADINKNSEEGGVDLVELANILWDKRKYIAKYAVVGLVIGIIIAISIPKEYTTTVILTSESGTSAPGGMGTLASMAGINLGGGGDLEIFTPDLYPNVLNSTPFIQGLLNVPVVDTEQEINTTFYSYIKDHKKKAWWEYILKAPGSLVKLISSGKDGANIPRSVRFISNEDMRIIQEIQNLTSITTEKKVALTTIQVTMQSSQISAFIADTLTSHLQNYIIEKRTQKARTDLVNTEKLFLDAKANYEVAQRKLATFIDGNMNVVSARFKTNQEKLQNEANMAFSLYTQMAQQVQLNKIKVQDNTPVFTVIQPATEPISPSKPSKVAIVIAFIFLFTVIGIGWVFKGNTNSKPEEC